MIYLIRHGESLGITEKRLQTPGEPLTENGLEQARWLLTICKDLGIRKVYVSPMQRTQDTAKEAFKDLPVEILIEPLIEEKRNGDWEGLTVASIDWTEINTEPFLKRHAPNGESLLDVQKRAEKFLEKISGEEGIALVSHGTFMRILMAVAYGDDVEKTIFSSQFLHGCICCLGLNNLPKKY